MKTTHEILIFKKRNRYDIFVDGIAVLEDAEMTKNHIAISFTDETCNDRIGMAIASMNGILDGLPSAKRSLIKSEINKLEKILK